MGSAADNAGNGSATPSELGHTSLVTDVSDVTDDTILPAAAGDHAGDKPNTVSTGPKGGQDTSGSSSNGEDDSSISGIWVLLFWTAIGVFIALSNHASRIFIFRWWWAILLLTAVVGTVLAIPPSRKWLKKKPVFRAGLFIFGVIPLLLALIGSVTVLPQRYQLIALRSVILVTVCLLPAVMWFLFIAARKASLLAGFLANLYRLGLLTPSPRCPFTGGMTT
jgi:hypothetical protein